MNKEQKNYVIYSQSPYSGINGSSSANYDRQLSGQYLLDEGIVMLGAIDAETAQTVVCQVKYLAAKYPTRPIQLWINSPGGEVNAGMAIYDIINTVQPEIHVVVMGMACSMGAFIASSGTYGERSALKNSEFLIHQPLGGVSGQATDIINAAKHIEKTRDMLNTILAYNTGKSKEQIALDTDRDYVMTAQEALEYGLIDKIIDYQPKAGRRS